jgi:uncharacterized damage-inducible protein DinB
MTLADLFVAQLDSEAKKTRRVLEHVPEGRDDWKPHDKSMPLGRLAMLVARMPTWFSLILGQDELDLNPPGGSNVNTAPLATSRELVQAHDQGVADARTLLAGTSDDRYTNTTWKLLVSRNIVSEDPRYIVVRDTFMHWAHHRGQLTVYLRLNNATVPSVYGPTADDSSFG